MARSINGNQVWGHFEVYEGIGGDVPEYPPLQITISGEITLDKLIKIKLSHEQVSALHEFLGEALIAYERRLGRTVDDD